MNESKSARYQRSKRRGRLAEICAAAVLLAVAAFVPVSPWLPLGLALVGAAILNLRELPIRAAVAAGAAGVVVASMAIAASWWWLAAGAAFAGAGVVGARVAPELLVRLADARPIDRRSLMAGLREIASRSRVQVSDILEWRVEEGARATAL